MKKNPLLSKCFALFFFFFCSCLGTGNAVFTKPEWIGQAEEAVLTGRVYSWKKKKKKRNAQCEFCSLTDFGGESAENKAASVQLPLRGFLVAPQVFIKLLCEKGDTSGSPLTLTWPARTSACASVRAKDREAKRRRQGQWAGKPGENFTPRCFGALGRLAHAMRREAGEACVQAACMRPSCTLRSHVLWINICV